MYDTARARHTQTHFPRRDASLKYEQDSLTPCCQLLRQRLFADGTRCCLSVASGSLQLRVALDDWENSLL